jgi:hypothetical protein
LRAVQAALVFNQESIMKKAVGSIACMLILSIALGAQPTNVAKLSIAKIQIRQLTYAVEIFYLREADWPKNLKELTEGEPPILKDASVFLDPWKKPYQYDKKGPKNNGEKPDIWTVTPDKKVIGNWKQEKQE